MRLRVVAVAVLAASLAVLGGCKKKKPPVPTAQQQAPTITEPQREGTPTATQQAEPQETAPAQTQPSTGQPPKQANATKPKPKPAPRKPAVAKNGDKKPPRTVVKEGENQPPVIAANIPPQGPALAQRQATTQLLQATDKNLGSVRRVLNDDEQAMLQQIRNFMKQSRAADNDGDFERSYNLALKAKLLSDELVKR